MRHPTGSRAPWSSLVVGLLVLAAALTPAAASAALSPLAAARLDPRLAALTASDAPVSAWVTFADKGEQGPADLARMLAEAEAAMTPANRARRLRCGVTPLVGYDDLPLCAAYVDDLRARGLAPYGASRWGNEVAVRVPGTRLAELAVLPHVARLRPVERATRMTTPAPGPEFAAPLTGVARDRALAAQSLSYGFTWSQLHLENIPAVHDSGYIGTGVTICMLDDGFNYHDKHSATRNANVPFHYERDFIRGLWTAQDTLVDPSSFRHGMWTMGCIAGNLAGTYVGAAPGATFALGRTEYDPTETLIELTWWRMGAEWADSLGADVISSSLGYGAMDNPADDITYAMRDGHTSECTRAAEIAAAKGILVVSAAGNNGGYAYPDNKVLCPADANGDSVIAAGAVFANSLITGFSALGPNSSRVLKPDLVARGASDSLVSASGNPNAYTANDGTSFSTPIIAGLAACLIQARPTWPATQIIQALVKTASRAATPDTVYGNGVPDGLAALRWVPGTAVVPPTPLPAGFLRLSLAGPNPLHAGDTPARVRVELGADAPAGSAVQVRIYDTQGRRVRTLPGFTMSPGDTTIATWDGTDDAGRVLRAGVYLVSVETAGRSSTLRLVSLR